MRLEGKKSYLKNFSKFEYLITALLFAAITTALLIAINEYGVAIAIFSNKKMFAAILIACIYYFAIIIIAFLCKVSKGKVSLFDSFFWSLIISGILYFAYYAFILGKIGSVPHLIIAASMLIIGLAFVLLSAAKHIPDGKKVNFERKNKICAYYASIGKKYSTFIAILLSVLITLCEFLSIFNAHFIASDFAALIVLIICVLPLVLYLIFGISDRVIGLFDFVLVSFILSLPCMFLFVYYSPLSENMLKNYYITAAAMVIIALFYTVFRWVCSDPKAVTNPIYKTNDTKIANYFANFSSKYNLIFAIACGGILTVINLIAFSFSYHGLYADLLRSGNAFGINAFFMYILSAVSYSTLILCGIIAFINIPCKHVNIGDFALIVCISFSVFGLISFISSFSKIGCVTLSATLLFSLTVLFARIKNVFSK